MWPTRGFAGTSSAAPGDLLAGEVTAGEVAAGVGTVRVGAVVDVPVAERTVLEVTPSRYDRGCDAPMTVSSRRASAYRPSRYRAALGG